MDTNFFLILGRDENGEFEFLGDLTLMGDGNAVVNNDYDGTGNQYFDNHKDALDYIKGRICDNPVYYDPVVNQLASIRVL